MAFYCILYYESNFINKSCFDLSFSNYSQLDMELYPAEVDTLGRLVEEWSLHDDRELEATFKNASDTTTFLNVAQRLKAKGYTALPQEDKMNIITPQHLRR